MASTNPPGVFCWPELAAREAKGAVDFYSSLFGWAVTETPTDMGPYYIFKVDGDPVAAAFAAPPDQGPPHWNSYVAVASADESAKRAAELGGKVIAQPFDVFDAGRMAVLQDPTGAFVSVWQAKQNSGVKRNEPGMLCWTELATNDTDRAEKFYTSLFGWTAKRGSAPPGEYIEIHNKGEAIGGMTKIQAEWGNVPPNWLPYFSVVDCDQSAARAKELGASLQLPPTDIPGIGRFSFISDTQGATFAIIALRQAA